MRKKGTRRLSPHLAKILPALGYEGEWSGNKRTGITHRSLEGVCDGFLTILKVNLEEDKVWLECEKHVDFIILSLTEVESKVG